MIREESCPLIYHPKIKVFSDFSTYKSLDFGTKFLMSKKCYKQMNRSSRLATRAR